MSDPRQPVRRPPLGLGLLIGSLVVLVGGLAVWQQVRWTFAEPLALAFREQPYDSDRAAVIGPEIRKFISLDILAAGKLAEAAGFECRALTFGAPLGLCYRDVWTGLCNEVWSVELTYDKDRKVIRSSGRKRRLCYFG